MRGSAGRVSGCAAQKAGGGVGCGLHPAASPIERRRRSNRRLFIVAS
jgi:hypothetical protein